MDYHLTYLKCDVLLLADVFENFRKTCHDYYELDPSNYISSPSLAWDAMLLNTKIELGHISDYGVMSIIDRQKRGGLCFVGSKRHAVANNKYMPWYDKSKPEGCMLYRDANNLHGWAMSQSLPYRDIKINKRVNKYYLKSLSYKPFKTNV